MYKKVCCTCKVAFLLFRPIVVFSPFSLPLLLCITWFYILFVPTINIIKSFLLLPWLNLYNYYYCCQWSKKIIWFWNKHCSWMSTTLKTLAKIWENRCCGTLFEGKNIEKLGHENLNCNSRTHYLFMQTKSNKWQPFGSGGRISIPNETAQKTPCFHLRWNMIFIWNQTLAF